MLAKIIYALGVSLKAWWRLSIELGHLRSAWYWRAEDQLGNATPWFSYPALHYLHSLDLRHKTVFEFGSGGSTIYFANLAAKVDSVEHDESWYQQLRDKINQLSPRKAKKVFLQYQSQKSQYITSLSENFDLIIIDGVWRAECAKRALNYLNPNGVIILDNSNVQLKAKRILDKSGLLRVDFRGFCPIVSELVTTSFYFAKK